MDRSEAAACEAALDVEAPALDVSDRIGQRREGDPKLARPAVIGSPRLGPPHAIPRLVLVPPVVGYELIFAHAIGVDREHVAVAAVSPWVDQDGERVVAAAEIRLEVIGSQRGALLGAKRNVEMVAIVSHPDRGRLACERPFARRALAQLCDRSRSLPDRLVEPAVQRRRLSGADGGDRLGKKERVEEHGEPLASTATQRKRCSVVRPILKNRLGRSKLKNAPCRPDPRAANLARRRQACA